MKKIPIAVQSLLCANSHINTFKSAIEELVYNSLDAEANSIAIRIDASKGCIQVVDNGNGITKTDLHVLGQRYMTSKFVDNSTLKPLPNKYGFQGQSLANIIKVSKVVKIISRFNNQDETWLMTYYKGKQQEIVSTSKRPLKGTTVEIKSFLYNLHIPKKTNDVIVQIPEIKLFLEQISLAHINVSITLRDDSKNEIIFKVTKKRDIYQTLTEIFEIGKSDLQELKVEKNRYKAIAYISKKVQNSEHWINLNGKFLKTCKIHKIINDCFIKSFVDHKQTMKKSKVKNINNEEEKFQFNKIPFYLVFIICPYDDYDNISNASKHSIVEFKDWDPLTKLLEKLVKFFFGDLNVKEINKNVTNNENYNESTRDKVKKIMEKILKPSKKFGVSQIQNGVKGKLAKRKKKKMTNISLTKVISPKNKEIIVDKLKFIKSNKSKIANVHMRLDKYVSNNNQKPRTDVLSGISPINSKKLQTDNTIISPTTEENKICGNELILTDTYEKNKRVIKSTNYNYHNKDHTNNHRNTLDGMHKRHKTFIKNFGNPTKEMKFDDIDSYLNCYIKNKAMDEKTEASWNYLPRTTHQYQPNVFNQLVPYTRDVQTMKTGDLLHTVLNSQAVYDKSNEKSLDHVLTKNKILVNQRNHNSQNIYDFPFEKATYNSHKDYLNVRNDCNQLYKEHKKIRYITNQSRENFNNINCNKSRERKIKAFNFKPHKSKKRKSLFSHLLNTTDSDLWTESSKYKIEFTKTIESNFIVTNAHKDYNSNISFLESSNKTKGVSTNTLNKKDLRNIYSGINLDIDHKSLYLQSQNNFTNYNFNCHRTYTINESNNSNNLVLNNHDSYYPIEDKSEKQVNYVFISKSQDSNDNLILNKDIEPLDICETVLDSNIVNDKEMPDKSNTMYCYELLNKRTEKGQNHFDSLKLICNNEYDINKCLETNKDSIFDIKENRNKNSVLLANAINFVDTTDGLNEDLTSEIEYPRRREIEENSHTDEGNLNKKFDFNNRLRFLPKGMSPIFKNCNTKNACNYILETDYYEDRIYNEFACNVEVNADIFQPNVQQINKFTSNSMEKLMNKLNKINASLVFNDVSLKNAKIIGQVDFKFIAAIVKGKCINKEETLECLVLFDQHAVHERIKLEQNLSDYQIGDSWQTTPLEGVVLKLKKSDITYLHNYKDKFVQLGMQWTFLNESEIRVDSIPKAVLGKHERLVEVVIDAINNIISEEIDVLKTQGCISLYPKSLMNLVASEACRYAIKFGDGLSLNDCIGIIKELADCKTPYQCAHGRPVMAVLMKIKPSLHEYEIDITKLKNIKKK